MKADKQQAILLRQQGNSYSEISQKIYIPKSTLSYWLKDVLLSPKIKKQIVFRTKQNWAKNITEYNHQRAKLVWEKRTAEKNKYSLQIERLSKSELKLVGISLYWAEGDKKSKWAIMFCNADPKLIQIMMRFFREICLIPENKFRPSVQIHDRKKDLSARRYWAKVSGISIKQFNKTIVQISKASKFKRPYNSLPYGTFRIYIFDKRLVDKINGWIMGLGNQKIINVNLWQPQ